MDLAEAIRGQALACSRLGSAMYADLLTLASASDLPFRLFEIGSSAGLNLHADRFAYVTEEGSTVGPQDSPVVLDPAWTGPVP